MSTEYIEFDVILKNGEQCRVRYCDEWGASLFGKRTIHFEFLGCSSISHTKYHSEFLTVGIKEKINPEELAKEIIEDLTGIVLSGKNIQEKLI